MEGEERRKEQMKEGKRRQRERDKTEEEKGRKREDEWWVRVRGSFDRR